MKKNRRAIVNELEYIRAAHPKRLLQPRAILQYAKPPTSPLHACFEWNDGKAAERFRLQQARELIVSVEIIHHAAGDKPIQAYVSLPTSRTQRDGGYHFVMDVLSSEALRREMLESALNDLQNFELRYARLRELVDVFRSIKGVRRKYSKKAGKRGGKPTRPRRRKK